MCDPVGFSEVCPNLMALQPGVPHATKGKHPLPKIEQWW